MKLNWFKNNEILHLYTDDAKYAPSLDAGILFRCDL